MEFVFDMGAHARFIWPAYAAFLAIFAGLALWAWVTAGRARAELEKREKRRERRE